jgi:hypothetical protein
VQGTQRAAVQPHSAKQSPHNRQTVCCQRLCLKWRHLGSVCVYPVIAKLLTAAVVVDVCCFFRSPCAEAAAGAGAATRAAELQCLLQHLALLLQLIRGGCVAHVWLEFSLTFCSVLTGNPQPGFACRVAAWLLEGTKSQTEPPQLQLVRRPGVAACL